MVRIPRWVAWTYLAILALGIAGTIQAGNEIEKNFQISLTPTQ